MSKKINQLTPASDAEVANDTMLYAIADAGTGIAKSASVLQVKAAVAGFKIKYVATGSEGSTLTIAELDGMEILIATREGGIIYEVSSAPDPAEFTHSGDNIGLGVPVGMAGERFSFIYKKP